MDTTLVLIALITGFTVVTIFSLAAFLVVRRREKKRDRVDSERVSKTIEDLDKALDAALTEINKLGALVKSEVDEKYKSILFLYNLVEEKQKEIEKASDGTAVSKMMEKYAIQHEAKLRVTTEACISEMKQLAASQKTVAVHTVKVGTVAEPEQEAAPPAEKPPTKKPAEFTNPKHKQIWEKREKGQSVPDIAKELNMGQGEVKLILDLIERAG